MSRAAIYLRVSTDRQTTDNQRGELEAYAVARGLQVVETFDETASAVKKRPQFERLMIGARRRAYDVVLVWALDRFGRSMFRNLRDVLELDELGVGLISLRESWLDTRGPARSLLIAVFSWAAEQERNRLIERTNVGIARARANGTRLGRTRKVLTPERARDLKATGLTWAEVGKQLGCSGRTARRRAGATKGE